MSDTAVEHVPAGEREDAAERTTTQEASEGDLSLPNVNVHFSRLALVLTGLMLAVVLALVPIALFSLGDELLGQDVSSVYDQTTGQQIDPSEVVNPETAFVNITVNDIDEARRVATLTVSGHRVCGAVCPEVRADFFSIGNDAARRRGLPPSASITVPAVSDPFTFTIELPVRGTPQRYPFDNYVLLLGTIARLIMPGGRELPVSAADLERLDVSFTVEDQVARLNMSPPEMVDPATVRSPNDPADFLLVDRLEWQRPTYLRILSVLLVLLISASGIFALSLRSLNELLLGIGGIILGIWGVRSVVVQSPLPDVTLIDLILGFVIMVLLAAMSLRVARYLYRRSKETGVIG